MRTGPHQARPGHPCLSKVWAFSTPESRDPVVGSPDPTQRGLGPVPEIQVALAGVQGLPPEVQSTCTGVDTFPWGSGPTVGILECVIFSGHMTTLGPSMWRGEVLFTVRLEIAARAPCLHTVVRGTPDLGYRQWPPGPPQGRIQACRWDQSLTGDWPAASIVITANQSLVTSTATLVSAAD
jgi:hypothetical protein